jgi:electron transport complex protein RnfG
MYRAMVGVGALCGLLIVSVYQATRPRIERLREEALQRAILEVVPGAATSRTFVEGADGSFSPAPPGARGGRRLHAAYAANGALAGVALEAAGMGYQDTIRLIWGFSPEAQTAVGLKVLESKETPGLGDKILFDPAFLENFRALDLALDGETLVHAPVAVKHGEKREAWQVDGITGATISSKAIAKIVGESAADWAPRVRARRAELEERE